MAQPPLVCVHKPLSGVWEIRKGACPFLFPVILKRDSEEYSLNVFQDFEKHKRSTPNRLLIFLKEMGRVCRHHSNMSIPEASGEKSDSEGD